MTLALYGHPFSSYTQKALIALWEKGLAFEFKSLEDSAHGAEWMRRWPMAKMPLLVDGDRQLVETSIIIEYLEIARPTKHALIPADPMAALDVRFLDRALAIVEERRLGVMVREFLRLRAHLVVRDRLAERREPCRAGLERTPAGERVGLVGDPAPVDGLSVHAVPLVVVRGRDGRVNRDFVEVRAAEARDLRIYIGVDAPR